MVIEVRLRVALILLTLLVVIATIFYNIVEGWGLLNSFYFSVSTASTVGHGDFVPTTNASKLFTIFYMVISVVLVLYSIALVAQQRIIFHLNLHRKQLQPIAHSDSSEETRRADKKMGKKKK